MKRLITLVVACLLMVCMGVAAQTKDRKLRKKEMDQLQAQIDSAQHAEALSAIADTAFTLQADRVVFKYGQRAYVVSNTNFVAVANGRATVQVSFNIPVAGPNGMGGVTVEGQISDYRLTFDKHDTAFLRFNVQGAAISAQVFITMYKYSNVASVDILPNFNSNRITLEGVILPNNRSFVVQGNTL